MIDLDAIRRAIDPQAPPTGDVRCPVHDDRHASLSVGISDAGRLVCHCHAGCDQRAVWDEVRRRAAHLLNGHAHAGKVQSRKTEYIYTDAAGRPIAKVVRTDLLDGGKKFAQQTPDGKGGWQWKGPKGATPLYRLAALAAAPALPVVVCEGEKSCEAAQRLLGDAYVATSWMGGADQADRADLTPLQGRDVIVWPDADPPGKKAAATLLARLGGIAARVRVVRVDDLPPKADAADVRWTLQEFERRIAEHTPPRKASDEHDDETAGYALGDDADDRAEIDCTAGRRDRVVDHCMTIFASHPAVYARGGQLVRVVRADKLGHHDRLRTDAERLLIAPCAAEWIATELVRRAVFRKWDRRARKLVDCDPPSWVAPAMLADGEFAGVRPLRGITSAPVLRADGTVWATPGYDAATGMLLAARGALPTIPQAPNERDAKAALARLRVLLSGYQWADTFSEAVALSLILTKPARHLMPTAPLHLFTSPTAGSGKTQIVEAASIIADGVHPSLCSWPGDDEEMRKAISAALLAGESFVCFDNIANGKTLRSAALDKTLTASIVGDRLLGKMDRLTLVNSAVWAATGNNIQPCADMVRRTIVARIDPRTERPWERRFDWTPAAYAREHRGELLAAALTILAAHLRANTAPLAPPLQSFDAWSRIVRDALLWLGMPDAARSQDAIADEDPDAEDRAELIGALRRQYGTGHFGAEDVAQAVRNGLGASEASDVGRLASVINARLNGKPATGLRVGHLLRAIKDQVSNGVALRGRLDKHAGAVRWRIEDV